MESEICAFTADKTGSFCKILVGEKCDGKNKCCSFFKTEEQFNSDRDRAIILNRETGNCTNCRYMGRFCKTSAEETVVKKLLKR
ncbi:MAG: hypothetical protein K2J08_05180 [Ruminococcus sp.]|nr:hypothetical protein [Ruminococcus sp.]